MNQIFDIALIAPLVWLSFYGVLLITRARVGESIPLIGLKFLMGLVTVCHVALLFGDEIHQGFSKWVNVPGVYDFPLDFHYTKGFGVVTLAMLLIVSVIVKYSQSYLHKEPGFSRFFFLLSIFLGAFPFVLFANNLDTVFIGWELIGVTSVLLIGFYEKREHATINSWWAITTYRFCDMGLLAASCLAHYAFHTTSIADLNSSTLTQLHPEHASWMIFIAFLIVVTTLGKAAQLPFTPWITRAMEGPTPSSALYYGALSIGLGPLLLLKFQPLILSFLPVQIFVIVIGASSALYAYFVGSTRSDVKSVLAMSAVLEISLMVLEVGLGFHKLVIFHFVANAFLRVFQFLRSMNAIHDFYDNPMFYKGSPHKSVPIPFRWFSPAVQRWFYYRAVNGFGLEWILINGIVRPWLHLWLKVNQLENKVVMIEKLPHATVNNPMPGE